MREDLPFNLFEVNLSEADDSQLLQISEEFGLALDLKEMKRCKEYFSDRGRNPTDVELQSIAQTWSEHCYHRTFKGNTLIDGCKVKLFQDYIAKVTKDLSPSWCVSVFEDNAGIIKFDEDRAIAAKVETHNHPSAIEPFGGAATGIGGIIRDILGVWARPIANTDVLCFGPLNYSYEELLPGTKHPKYLLRGVTDGIGCYGNNMGVPTVNGAIYFDEGYVGNIAVYCGCIGTLPINAYVKDPKPGDVLVLAGGRTGRDGIHGVTFASVELTEESEESSRPAVQIANPIMEEKLKRAIISIRDERLGSAITDLGGGGLSSAVGEMAHSAGCGVSIHLDEVPLRTPDIDPWEIWISESQERMLVVVRERELERVLKIFENEEVEATPIGEFNVDGILRVNQRGDRVAKLDLDFLFNPPEITKKAVWKRPNIGEPQFSVPEDLEDILLRLLASPNVASKESVVRTYDHEVQGVTALKPLQGKYGGPNDAAVLKPFQDSWKGVVISSGINPSYGKIDPYWMAASAIGEAISNNIAVGGRRISLLDNFTWGNPDKPEQLGKLVRACKACYDFAKAFEAPFISGKDSLNNESPLGPVASTLLITAVGLIPDIRKAVSMELKEKGASLYIIGETYPEFGGSEYYKLFGFVGESVPKVKAKQTKERMDLITKAIDSGYINACHDLSEGGLGVAASEMAFSGGLGLELDLKKVPTSMRRDDFILFSESNGRFLVEVPKKLEGPFQELMASSACSRVGIVGGDRFSVEGLNAEKVIDAEISELREIWKRTLDGR
ncbi:hypothetical protein AKJ45_01155 [candidate division MSBL1 archaeon SCGC-AAA261F19]|uniref:Phosphoribosylformylglycinamidine synthase subunit PurL n=2 Tax=candidate division MSBL1 TaxID=215777 RepID=A0A133VAY6_9EURY|nr:hypothetical protein AKJ43_00140 [candidate division MSBL1 archaeon SCGC-AAA261D19]KXB03599.1 hypothetical protein AKJ45_01155 [candidate division MSBL1 archaeon SCGC-AAA261F19]